MDISGSGSANAAGNSLNMSVGTSSTGYAMALGGELDVNVSRALAIRLGQVDFLRTHSATA
jgi:hypothetical protein